MNAETPTSENGDAEPAIVLVKVAEIYYLAQGEEYLSQIMLVDGTFPKPIRCLKFENRFDFSIFAGGKVNLADLWGINPEIISRLRRDGHLIEIDAS